MNRSTTGILFLEIMHMWIRTRMPDIQYHMPAMWKFQRFQKFQKSLENSWFPADWVICFWELRPCVHKRYPLIQNWSLVYITLISVSLYFRTIPFSRLVLHINDYFIDSLVFIGSYWLGEEIGDTGFEQNYPGLFFQILKIEFQRRFNNTVNSNEQKIFSLV